MSGCKRLLVRRANASFDHCIGRKPIDVFDIFAFVVFGILLSAVVIVVVTLGQLPGQIAAQRKHPQAAAINIASWLGVATLGILWPFAMIWAFTKPYCEVSRGSDSDEGLQRVTHHDSDGKLAKMQAQVDTMQASLDKLKSK